MSENFPENRDELPLLSWKEPDPSKQYKWSELPPYIRQISTHRQIGCCSESQSTLNVQSTSDDQQNCQLKISERNDYGIIKKIKCLKCMSNVPIVYRGNAIFYRERIDNVEDLKPGDHIAWYRIFGYWHHAIFLSYESVSTPKPADSEQEMSNCFVWRSGNFANINDTDGNETRNYPLAFRLSVIEYTPGMDRIVVKESNDVIWQPGRDMYRFHYEECYNPEYTIALAKEAAYQFNENNTDRHLEYDLLSDNCEHFARSCKTGKSDSGQIRDCRYTCEMSLMRWLILFLFSVCLAFANSSFVVCSLLDPSMCETNTEIEILVTPQYESLHINKHKWRPVQLLVSTMMSSVLTLILVIHAIVRALAEIRVPRGQRSEKHINQRQRPPAPPRRPDNQQGIDRENSKEELVRSNKKPVSKTTAIRLKPYRIIAWIFIRSILCRPCCECLPCIDTCCREGCPNHCRIGRCLRKDCCSNYCTVVLRVVVREIFATSLALCISFFYQYKWYKKVFPVIETSWDEFVQALIGFLILVAVSTIGLPIGHVFGTFVEKVLLSIIGCFKRRKKRCQSTLNDSAATSTLTV